MYESVCSRVECAEYAVVVDEVGHGTFNNIDVDADAYCAVV